MAAALEKQILASQKFLGTVRHLPSFADARDKQVENLLKKISKTPLQVEQAAVLVDRLDASIWGSHVDALGRASGSCRKARGLPRPWKSCSVSLVRKTRASSRWSPLLEPICLSAVCPRLSAFVRGMNYTGNLSARERCPRRERRSRSVVWDRNICRGPVSATCPRSHAWAHSVSKIVRGLTSKTLHIDVCFWLFFRLRRWNFSLGLCHCKIFLVSVIHVKQAQAWSCERCEVRETSICDLAKCKPQYKRLTISFFYWWKCWPTELVGKDNTKFAHSSIRMTWIETFESCTIE